MSCVTILFLYVALLTVAGTWGLRNVTLHISPHTVERGHNVHLTCQYDLEGAPLHEITFTRGYDEFYRYTPHHKPHRKVNPHAGINVDLSQSKAGHVVVRDVDYSLEGDIACHVATGADEEGIMDIKDSKSKLKVVELPKRRPEIQVDSAKRYAEGDRLQASCSSTPSRPPANLYWFIDDESADSLLLSRGDHGRIVYETPLVNDTVDSNTILSVANTTLDYELQSWQVDSPNITLRCISSIDDIYKEETLVTLQTLPTVKPSSACRWSPSLVAVLVSVLILVYTQSR